jgi:hypothetical protein
MCVQHRTKTAIILLTAVKSMLLTKSHQTLRTGRKFMQVWYDFQAVHFKDELRVRAVISNASYLSGLKSVRLSLCKYLSPAISTPGCRFYDDE